MGRMASFLLAAGMVVSLTVAQGCVSRLIDEGVEKGLGPTAKVLPMDPKWPAKNQNFLAAYKNFQVGPVQSEFADTPRTFMDGLPAQMIDQLVSKGLPMNKAGKTLVISITVLAYQPVTSYEKALGPTEEVVARVELKDKESGQVVGKAICIGRTYQSVGLGTKWKAWGLSRAVVNKWIDAYYPKEGRQEAEEKAPPANEQS